MIHLHLIVNTLLIATVVTAAPQSGSPAGVAIGDLSHFDSDDVTTLQPVEAGNPLHSLLYSRPSGVSRFARSAQTGPEIHPVVFDSPVGSFQHEVDDPSLSNDEATESSSGGFLSSIFSVFSGNHDDENQKAESPSTGEATRVAKPSYEEQANFHPSRSKRSPQIGIDSSDDTDTFSDSVPVSGSVSGSASSDTKDSTKTDSSDSQPFDSALPGHESSGFGSSSSGFASSSNLGSSSSGFGSSSSDLGSSSSSFGSSFLDSSSSHLGSSSLGDSSSSSSSFGASSNSAPQRFSSDLAGSSIDSTGAESPSSGLDLSPGSPSYIRTTFENFKPSQYDPNTSV